MEFTCYSFIWGLVWISLISLILTFIRKKKHFFKVVSVRAFLVMLCLCMIRLCVPLELPYTVTLEDSKVMPAIRQITAREPLVLSISLWQILLFVWSAGIVWNILQTAVTYYKLYCMEKRLPHTENEQIQRMICKVSESRKGKKVPKVIVHPSISSPAMVNFGYPVIFMPDLSFTDDELFGILSHEWNHYCRKHALFRILAEMISTFFWWNPLIGNLYVEFTYGLELDSDSRTYQNINSQQEKDYLKAMIKVVQHAEEGEKKRTVAFYFAGKSRSQNLKQRFELFLNGTYKKRKKIGYILYPLICAVFLLSYSVVIQPYGEPTLEDYGEMDEIPEGSYLVKTQNGGYTMYSPSGTFIVFLPFMVEEFSDMKVYERMEDVP